MAKIGILGGLTGGLRGLLRVQIIGLKISVFRTEVVADVKALKKAFGTWCDTSGRSLSEGRVAVVVWQNDLPPKKMRNFKIGKSRFLRFLSAVGSVGSSGLRAP